MLQISLLRIFFLSATCLTHPRPRRCRHQVLVLFFDCVHVFVVCVMCMYILAGVWCAGCVCTQDVRVVCGVCVYVGRCVMRGVSQYVCARKRGLCGLLQLLIAVADNGREIFNVR